MFNKSMLIRSLTRGNCIKISNLDGVRTLHPRSEPFDKIVHCKICSYSLSQRTRGQNRFYSSSSRIEHKQRPMVSHVDDNEIKKFSKIAQTFWNPSGEYEALHSMNNLRVPMIRDGLIEQCEIKNAVEPLSGLTLLDVGCGGGILSEALGRLGATVIGIDATGDNINVAQLHKSFDPALSLNVKYINCSAEDLIATEEGRFDGVIASEVVEHVNDQPGFIEACCKLVKPGGSLFLTTLNKTYWSYAIGIFAAENIANLVPKGMHEWEKFVSPQDLQFLVDKNGFTTRLVHGMFYNPITTHWSWIKDTSINYALHAVKHDITSTTTPESETSSSEKET
ncbi:unnamed protein product [Owenia fusiformis]|uniref:Ubiquinone biosynthesis O-methyltransferase, mitochondrial n=1 Tax=Owenia fusiformis TaxID=6347 RepID=A0A8J1XIW2_OWEFU|nr:unnamed protein product [Owenia fusiformis]